MGADEIVHALDSIADDVLPLSGRRILVTRAKEQSAEMSMQIRKLGGEPVEFPVIRIQPVGNKDDRLRLRQAIEQLEEYDWIVFTSVNGVRYFFESLRQLRGNSYVLSDTNVNIAAVGPRTADALQAQGLAAETVATTFQQEGLLEAMLPRLRAGQKALLPLSRIARDYLPVKLREHGLDVTVVAIYENVPSIEGGEHFIALLQERAIEIITFTSSSTVTYMFAAMRQLGVEDPLALLQHSKCEIACISPLTARTAADLGLKVHYVAEEATISSLLAKLADPS